MKKLLLSLALLWGLASPALAVVQGTQVGDAAYTITPTDTVLRTTTAFTASRAWTLPFAAGTCAGQTCKPFSNTITILDSANAISTASPMVITRQTGDTINGAAANLTVTTPGAVVTIWASSANNWTVVVQTSAGSENNGLVCTTFATMGAPAALTDVAIFIATRSMFLVSASEVHAVAAGGASVAQLTKDTGTDAPGAGTDLLTNNTNTGFDLNGTANTVQVGTITATAATRTFAAGNRLSIDWANAVQASSGIAVTACFAPL